MATFWAVEENVEVVGEFQGDSVLHPKYQCKKCGHSISPGFAQSTGLCGLCFDGKNSIGEYLERIYSVTIYSSGGAFAGFRDHKFTNAIDDIKEGEHAEKMADLLQWGIANFNDLGGADYLVPTPRGTEDAPLNHMLKIGEILSAEVGIPITDPLRKAEPYTSQKEIDDPVERLENVKDNIDSTEEFENTPKLVVIDDVATTCGTLKYSGKALVESGAGEVYGLAIGRSESIDSLVEAEVYQPEDED